MLVNLKEVNFSNDESSTFEIYELLNISEEEMINIQKQLVEITTEVEKAVQGRESSIRGGVELAQRLNLLSPEAILFAAISGINFMVLSVNAPSDPFADLLQALQDESEDELQG